MAEYQNHLANKFMRDTNYIIIKDTDDLAELERQWELFNTQMTTRQKRLSDDRSIEIWGVNNQDHYEMQKRELAQDIESPISDDMSDDEIHAFLYSDDEKVDDSEITNFVGVNYDDFELPDMENDIAEPIKEDTDPEPQTQQHVPDKIPIATDGSDEKKYAEYMYDRDIDKDNQADQYQIDSNINIIGTVTGVNADDFLDKLEKKFIAWNSQNQDHRKKSDDMCRQIYGMSNIDRYKKLKAQALKWGKVMHPKQTVKPEIDTDTDTSPEIKLVQSQDTKVLKEGFVGRMYKELMLMNEAEQAERNRHRRFNDTPYFTPSEMIDMGVHGNHNYYSKTADNDGLITNIRIPTWFMSYQDMCLDHIFEDYRKEWVLTMQRLYSDYEQIKESGNEEAIAARKQSILDLGWNPEIDFSIENRIKAAKRVSEKLDETIPLDVFINLDKVVPDEDIIDEPVVENAGSETHKPVFMVFVQGKAPIISSTIKKVTHSDYSHSGLSFDAMLDKVHSYNMFPEPGLVTESIKGYGDKIVSVCAFYAPNEVYSSMKEYVSDFYNNSKKTMYDFGILFNKLVDRNARVVKNKYYQVCSTFVDAILKAGSIDLVKGSNVPSPAELYNASKANPNKIIEVYNGPADKYDPKKVQKKMNKLLKKGTKAINEATLPAGITLRKATQADTENMFKWELESIDPSLRNDKKVISYIKQDVQDSISDTKMIMSGNDTVGMFTTCSIENGEFWYIGEIYLKPEFRNMGIGTVLLKNEMAKHDKIKLQVAQSNGAAIRLYKSLGFEIVETNDKAKMHVMVRDKAKAVTETAALFQDIIEPNDICHNVELFDSGDSNVIWVVGLSGSGKSRLAGELATMYNADHVEIDDLQRAKMENWTTTNCKLLDDYIKECGGLDAVFPYVNHLERITWKDIVSNEEECAKQYDHFFQYIVEYVKKHKNQKFVIEGVQVVFYDSPALKDIAEQPVIIKMTGPVKAEIRRELRTYQNGKDKGDSFFKIIKKIAHRNKCWIQGNFYRDDWKRLNDLRVRLGEDVQPFTEAINDLKNGVNPFSTKTFYHLSFDDKLDDEILKPRIPSWIQREISKNPDFIKELERLKDNTTTDGFGYEEYKTPRVCFSNSIEGALNSIINEHGRMNLAGKQIHVYTPEKPINEYKHKTNKQILKDGDIYDANITNEMWVLEPVKLVYVGSIVVDKVSNEHVKKFANNKNKTQIRYSYQWHWFRKIKYRFDEKKGKFVHESNSVLTEVKKFPVEFDKDGNLIIYKARFGNISYGDEIDDSVKLLETYRNAGNTEGVKYELAKLWFINDSIEKKLKKRLNNDEYKKLIDCRAVCLNVFKQNIEYVMKAEKGFNFSDYYNSTPFSDNAMMITANTIKYATKSVLNTIL